MIFWLRTSTELGQQSHKCSTNSSLQSAVGHFWLTSCYFLFVCPLQKADTIMIVFINILCNTCRTTGLIWKRKIKHVTYCNELSCQLLLLSALGESKRTLIQTQRQRMDHRNTHMSWECSRKSSDSGMWIWLQDNSRIVCNRENRFVHIHSTFCQSLPTAVTHLSQNAEMWASIASMSQAWVPCWYCPCPQQIRKYSCNVWSIVQKTSSSCNPDFTFLCFYSRELDLGLG